MVKIDPLPGGKASYQVLTYEVLTNRSIVPFLQKTWRFLVKWPWASLLMFASLFAHVITGIVVVAYPPVTRGEAGGVKIPASATCLRATRHADYTTVDVTVGTPAVTMPVLLRLDGIKETHSDERGLRFFSQDIVESKSVDCALDGDCTDVVYLASGTRQTLELNFASFGYRHGSLERSLYTTASRIRENVGELFLRKGHRYWLSSTHLCYAANASVSFSGGVPVNIQHGSMFASKFDLALESSMSETPAVTSTCECNSSNVLLFPELAAVEADWLSISDTGVYNSEPDGVNSRRYIAEIGVTCARNQTALQRDLNLYELDCTPYSACRDYCSVPYRRVSTTSLFVDLETPGAYTLKTKTDPTLESLPRLANSTNAFLSSLLKMTMITLAAAVVFVRSKKKTASSSWLMKNCLSISHRKGPMRASNEGEVENVFEDRVVGILAIVGRVTLVAVRIQSLSQDGQFRVCVAELVGAGLSVAHFWLRYLALVPDKDESPISKLGGSTAIIDSTAAVMIAFSESPTMAVSSSSFDPTARMLIAILTSVVVLPRCVFSAACCGALWPTFREDGRVDYAYLLMYSGLSWCVQSAILAITTCDLFVAPAAYSMSRATAGSPTAMFTIRSTLFLAIVVAGLPRLTSTSRHILSSKEHVD